MAYELIFSNFLSAKKRTFLKLIFSFENTKNKHAGTPLVHFSSDTSCDRTAKLKCLIKRNRHHLNTSGTLAYLSVT